MFLFQFHFFPISYDFVNISFTFSFLCFFLEKIIRKFAFLHLIFIANKILSFIFLWKFSFWGNKAI